MNWLSFFSTIYILKLIVHINTWDLVCTKATPVAKAVKNTERSRTCRQIKPWIKEKDGETTSIIQNANDALESKRKDSRGFPDYVWTEFSCIVERNNFLEIFKFNFRCGI